MKIKQNKVILFLAKYCIGAYMIHGGAPFLRTVVWNGIFKGGFYYAKPLGVYAYHYLISVILLFAIGVFAEFIYCNTIEKVIRKIYDMINLDRLYIK